MDGAATTAQDFSTSSGARQLPRTQSWTNLANAASTVAFTPLFVGAVLLADPSQGFALDNGEPGSVQRSLGYTPASPPEVVAAAFPPPDAAGLDAAVLGSTNPANTIALTRARALLQSLPLRPSRIAVTTTGSIACTFIHGRRYAIFTCDQDGDIVLTLTDRSSDAEAEAWMVNTSAADALAKTVRGFLEA